MDDIAKENNEMLVRRFVSAVGFDYQTDYRPHIHPQFSEDTVNLWEEVESRLSGPTVLEFDRDKCLSKIRENIQTQSDIMKSGPDYTTSYHYGVRSGLDMALRIIEDCIQRREMAVK